jgi:ribonuclease H2 subunit A
MPNEEVRRNRFISNWVCDNDEPLPDRATTRRMIQALRGQAIGDTIEEEALGADTGHLLRPPLVNVHESGPIIFSDVPGSCRRADGENCAERRSRGDGVLVGIDEAGRGSVLGPMVYGLAYWSVGDVHTVPKDFNDSKQLSAEQRTKLLDAILDTPSVGFATRILHASEISRNMLRSDPYNLNQMSHDATFQLIRGLIQANVDVHKVYVDTVGSPHHFTRRLEEEFGTAIEFVVESKCDANYAPCSAASVGKYAVYRVEWLSAHIELFCAHNIINPRFLVAKVLRDALMQNWQFSEASIEALPSRDKKMFGSGYPSDPTCQSWLERNRDAVFGHSDVVRFSWAPIKKALGDKTSSSAVRVEFAADLESDDQEHSINKKSLKRQQDSLLGFIQNKRKPFPYFQRKKFQSVTKL